jgi:hypothetical protein
VRPRVFAGAAAGFAASFFSAAGAAGTVVAPASVTSPRILSSVALPMPGTLSSSSMDLNGPFFVR